MAIFNYTIAAAAAALLSTLSPVLANWQYRSRPDLSPPRLNITIPAHDDVAPGYLFVAPYSAFDGRASGPEQPTAYIFHNDGDLVWSSLGYLAGWVANFFQAVPYQGRPVLQASHGSLDPFHGHGYGTVALLDHSYSPVATLQSLHKLVSIHEFRIVGEKTALVEVSQPIPYDLRPYGGNESQQWIVDGIWQELDIETGKLLFEGHSLDSQESVIPLTTDKRHPGTTSGDAWDYFHLNSVDKDDEGNYLISSRHTSTAYKVSGVDGSVIWRLGGRNSAFPLSNDVSFAYQHDARFLSRSADGAIETISLFDNAALTDGTKIRPSSSKYSPPLMTYLQGNAQVLPNGNVFVNWGQAGAVTEFRGSGAEPLFHAYLDSGSLGPGVQSYRGFRYEWEGRPRESPAVIGLQADSHTAVYVLWNGGTLGAVQRESFETVFVVSSTGLQTLGEDVRVFAVALDAEGHVVGRSSGVSVQDDIRPTKRVPGKPSHEDL
ncbi:ASST-domain-containing protein [Podospora didyma]|uniref:ASST-domain-containing protein n=1 Tax=Podospora didyma TaxID=330526 RepID=A0AAE0NHN0_9PEZI|nr:ASST-domain-containing protein [Podospora didyma]